MRRHAKAPSAGSTSGTGSSQRSSGRAVATRGASCGGDGSGARSLGRLTTLFAVFAMAILTMGLMAGLASAAPPQTVTMGDISDISYTSARATGEIDPADRETFYGFQYSTDGVFWNSGPEAFFRAVPANSGPTVVSEDLKNLQGGTEYFVRLVAFDWVELTEIHSPQPHPSFTTLPVAKPTVLATDDAAEVLSATAKVSGEVERPTGADPAFDAACRFEYVTAQQYSENVGNSQPPFQWAAQIPCDVNPVTATGPTPVSAKLSGLSPGTTYHLQLTAANAGGAASKEAANTFTTQPQVQAPSVLEVASSDIAYTTAKLSGEVERPAGVDPALDASCNFEYLTAKQFTENSQNSQPPFQGATQVPCDVNPVTSAGPTPVGADLTGLSPGTTYHLRLTAANAGGAASKVAAGTFTMLAPELPDVTIDPVSSFTGTTAHFSGDITPGGTDPVFDVEWRFECTPACPGLTGGTIPADNSSHEVTADAAGLNPQVSYRVRLVASNVSGSATAGPVFTSTVPVKVKTGSASPAATEAEIRGQVNPGGAGATYFFEFGPTSSYGQVTPTQTLPAGNSFVPVSADLIGLSPATRYHYRLVASNPAATEVRGADRSFTTDSSKAPACPNASIRAQQGITALAGCRAYELVSPSYKAAGNGVGVNDASGDAAASVAAGFGAHVGERFAVLGAGGNILLDGAFATGNDWALAERVSDQVGWRSHSPVTHPFHCPNNYRLMEVLAASPDLSTILWAQNAGFLPFFKQQCEIGPDSSNAGANGSVLVSDWGNPPDSPTRWEPIAPLEASDIAGGNGLTGFAVVRPTVSTDGSHIALTGPLRGLAGPTDPTIDTLGPGAGTFATASAYIDDVSAGPSDSWPGQGARIPAAACTGSDGGSGQARTRVPARNPDGSLTEATCEGAAPGRASRLVSEYGSAFSKGAPNSGSIPTSNLNTISSDGSRAFFMAPDPNLGPFGYPGGLSCVGDGAMTQCPSQLYVRQKNGDGEVVTRWISRPEQGMLDDPGQASLLGEALFEGASADGSKVFFRTASPLTADDPNGVSQTPANPNPAGEIGQRSWDLYMFELAPGPDGDPATPDGDPTGPGSELTRVSAGPSGNSDCNVSLFGEGAGLRFSSADGGRVYFSCYASLAGVADRSDIAAGEQGGTVATTNQSNLYLYDADAPAADRYTFIARIPSTTSFGSSTNEALTRCGSTAALRGKSTLASPTQFEGYVMSCWRGSEDGALVTFWTLGALTSDDPDPFAPGQSQGGSADIYAYDAESGELSRISAPQGPVDETYPCGFPDSGTGCYADPGMDSGSGQDQSSGGPLLNVSTDPASGEHSVFFESAARLVEADQNTAYDVYAWSAGKLSLVSPGAPDSAGAMYKGNSIDGKNVYFATRDALTWQDRDGVLDVYTARAGSQGIPEPARPVGCEVLADGCQSAPVAPPPASGAASSVLSGEGNVKPKPQKCGKGKVRRGGKCVKKKGKGKQNVKKGKNHKRAASETGRAHR